MVREKLVGGVLFVALDGDVPVVEALLGAAEDDDSAVAFAEAQADLLTYLELRGMLTAGVGETPEAVGHRYLPLGFG